MGACLSKALAILLQPVRGWAELGDHPEQLRSTVATFLLVFGPVPGISRLLSHRSMGWDWLASLIDSCWYSLVCLLLLLGAGLLLSWLSPRFGGSRDPASALHVAFYSSTPFWLSGVLFLIPSLLVHTVAPFLGLMASGHLLYLGLQQRLAVGPAHAIPLATLALAFFTLLFVLLTQVLPLPLLG